MKFSAMSRMISEKFQVVSTRIFDDIQIFSTSQLKEDFCPENSVLYFTDSFYRVNTETLQGSFLWYGNGPETLSSFSANWIQVREEDYRAVIDEINTILLYEFKSQSLRLRMIDIMMNGKGIAALVDEAAKSLNTTIALIDMSGKIITQSTPFKITDTLWAESIHAVRGSGGGYALSKPPSEINMEDVFLHLEGEISPVSCLGRGKVCQREGLCSTRAFWHQLDEHVRDFLRHQTLQNIIESERSCCQDPGEHHVELH